MSKFMTKRSFRLYLDEPQMSPDVTKLFWDALGSPSAQGPEMRTALDIMMHVPVRTSDNRIWPLEAPTSTRASAERFDSVLSMITDVIDDLEESSEWPDVFGDPRPQRTHSGWSDYLNAAALEDTDLVLTWLDDSE